MSTNRDVEKRLLKEFLECYETSKLCEIVRSVYHGGGIIASTREDAELLLFNLPYTQILSSKRIQIIDILKFLILKGCKPTANMSSRSNLCLTFKTLIESQSDYITPSMHVQSTAQIQTNSPNNMLALSQNNNVMNNQPNQIMPTPVPITNEISNSKSHKDHALLEEFIEMFTKHFYDLFNNLGVPGKNQLDKSHFYENCTMGMKMLGGSEEINEKYDNSTSSLQCLLGIMKEYKLYFSPHSSDVKWKKESHGLVKVQTGGTLHQGIGRMVGIFEQQFILRQDPQAENIWKILNTNLMMRNMESITSGSILSIQGQQANNSQIDIV